MFKLDKLYRSANLQEVAMWALKGCVITLVMVQFFSTVAYAGGRSPDTTIKSIIVNTAGMGVIVNTPATSGNHPCPAGNRNWWFLKLTHPNYDALASGFITAKAANLTVNIAGNGNCHDNGRSEEISWAYVAM